MSMEFKVGDKVKCYFFGDEIFELTLSGDTAYPLMLETMSGLRQTFDLSGKYYKNHTHPVLTLASGPKKKESVNWYRVSYHLKGYPRPECSFSHYKSLEEFLEGYRKEEFHFIHLELVVTHEYEINE